MDDNQLIDKALTIDTFAMVRIVNDGDAWVQYGDNIKIVTRAKAAKITAEVLKVIAKELNSQD
ncbi:TPA: hypothetical protein ACGF6J_003464 [Vibrio cholerae]|uniref:hypothetical protein n=1 Tax=Vibrio metschnikovii TaxID=28172 RepID=UPI001A18D7AF|nr:hypothetical protein [Vibrio metschnikovii]HAS3567199.1 hypothetical protein [Vibrio cholerae]